jgi:hypothetical protein
MPAICATPGCINELTPRTKLETCSNCRASVGNWKKRRPAERLERRRKLKMYDNRMATLVEDSDLKAHIRKQRGE